MVEVVALALLAPPPAPCLLPLDPVVLPSLHSILTRTLALADNSLMEGVVGMPTNSRVFRIVSPGVSLEV